MLSNEPIGADDAESALVAPPLDALGLPVLLAFALAVAPVLTIYGRLEMRDVACH